MKRGCGVIGLVAAVSILLVPAVASANMLVNPGLEDYFIDEFDNPVPTGWGLWQSAWEGWGSPSWITPHIDDGTAYSGLNAWEHGAGDDGASGNGGYSLLIQDIPSASPGVAYTMSAYAADALGGSTTEPGLKLEFYDADGALISFNEVLIEIPDDGDYYYIEQTTIAPEGTVWMKAIALATEWSGGRSAYRFDDLVLTPEPATLALLGLGALAVVRRRRG
jgi:hypothetical protein